MESQQGSAAPGAQHKEKKGLGRLVELSGVGTGGLAAGVGCAIAAAVLQAVPYLAVYAVLASMLDGIATGAGPFSQAGAMLGWAGLACAAMASSLALDFLSSMLCHGFAFRAICAIRGKLVEHVRTLPMGRFSSASSGVTMQVLQADVDQLEGFLAHLLPDFVSTGALLACLFAAMFAFDVRLALVVLAVIAIGFASQFVPMVKLLKAGALKENFDALERINAASTEYVHGMPSVKMFGQTPRSFAGFQRDIEAYRDFTVGLSRTLAKGMTAFRAIVLSVASFVAPVAVALWLGASESADMAAIAAFFLVFAPAAALPTLKLRTFSEGVNMMGEATSRIERLLDESPLPRSATVQVPAGNDVAFEHVGFAYGEGEKARAVLDDVSFAVPEGAFVALVGASGAGKSTVTRLLCRFWDVDAGRVLVGGVDVRDMDEAELARRLSFVFQENHLFAASIADNIRMGRPAASDAEVEAAARAARVWEFADALPQGLNALVGEGGAGLSGGERQRIAIARALVKDAPVLVLDEPTASMDADTERDVQDALRELARGRTVIMVAHRLGTVTNADCILVMDGGRIVERGTHDELAAAQGAYRALWDASQDAASWRAGARRTDAHAGKEAQR